MRNFINETTLISAFINIVLCASAGIISLCLSNLLMVLIYGFVSFVLMAVFHLTTDEIEWNRHMKYQRMIGKRIDSGMPTWDAYKKKFILDLFRELIHNKITPYYRR